MLGLGADEASALFVVFHEGLPYVKDTMEHMKNGAETEGVTRTILGRIRHFDTWEPKVYRKDVRLPALTIDRAVSTYGPNIRRAYLHKSLNAIVQGSAADLMKMAIVKCSKAGIFDAIGVPRLVVHDELIYSMKEGYKLKDFRAMRDVMENAIKFKVPIRTEGEIGPNWANTTPVKDSRK